MASYDNVLITKAAAGRLCKAFGVRLVGNPLVVQLARNAGFDALFIDMEHSTLSLNEVSSIAYAGLLSSLTPFVRIPHQCGAGLVQQLLDSGAFGIVFPHIASAEEARVAVRSCKFPPRGTRSMWGQQPVLGLRSSPLSQIIEECDRVASSVLLIIEAAEAVRNIEAIAAVEGVDVLLVGCYDLSTDLGCPGVFTDKSFQMALEQVSAACKRHGRVMGLAGLYNHLEIQEWAINKLNVRLMVCQQDSNLLAMSAVECAKAVASIDRTELLN